MKRQCRHDRGKANNANTHRTFCILSEKRVEAKLKFPMKSAAVRVLGKRLLVASTKWLYWTARWQVVVVGGRHAAHTCFDCHACQVLAGRRPYPPPAPVLDPFSELCCDNTRSICKTNNRFVASSSLAFTSRDDAPEDDAGTVQRGCKRSMLSFEGSRCQATDDDVMLTVIAHGYASVIRSSNHSRPTTSDVRMTPWSPRNVVPPDSHIQRLPHPPTLGTSPTSTS